MLTPLSLPRRYLVGFDPRDLPHHFADVLVIGGGLAGLRAALGIPDPYRVLVVTKDDLRESNSAYAQGGIAGVLDPEDRFDDHIADTLAAGKGLCDPEVVEIVVRAVIVKARAQPNLRIWDKSFTVDLVVHEGRCRGALVWDPTRGPALVWA